MRGQLQPEVFILAGKGQGSKILNNPGYII